MGSIVTVRQNFLTQAHRILMEAGTELYIVSKEPGVLRINTLENEWPNHAFLFERDCGILEVFEPVAEPVAGSSTVSDEIALFFWGGGCIEI